MVAQRTRSTTFITLLLLTAAGLFFLLPSLGGFSVPDTFATIPPSGLPTAEGDDVLVGGVLVKVASQHDEAEEVFLYAKETFGRLPEADFKALSSRQFRNHGYEAILYTVKHPNLGWSGVFIRAWLDGGGCSVPTVFAFQSEDWMETVISRDGYRWPANILEACGGSFPPAPKFRR